MKIKKIFLALSLTFLTFFALFPHMNQVHASVNFEHGTWYSPGLGDFVIKVWDSDETEIFGERYTYAQTHWIFYSIVSLFLPDGIENCVVAISTDETFLGMETPDFDAIPACSVNNLLQGVVTEARDLPDSQPFASVLYQEATNNPLSGVGFLRDRGEKLNLVEEVYAQEGFGFNQLAPVQVIWSASRDVAYFLLVIIAIILAFMIMFRTKTSPQTVITVQSTIPKLMIALVLITFSYAIAGLLIDVTYLIIGLFALMVEATGIVDGSAGPAETFLQMLTSHPLISLYLAFLIYTTLIIVLAGIGSIIGTALSFGVMAPIFGAVGALSSLFMIIFAIVLIVVYVRIVWMLVKTFIQVVLLTIVGPFYILMGTLPGSGGVSAWIKSLAAQLVVFPTVVIMLFMSHFFFWGLRDTGPIGNLLGQIDFINPYNISTELQGMTGTIGLPGFNMGTGLFGLVGSFAILFLTPHAANIIKSMVQNQPFGYGSAISAPLGGAGAYAWGRTAPYRQYETGRQVYEGTGLIGGALNKLPISKTRQKSLAQTIWGYRP